MENTQEDKNINLYDLNDDCLFHIFTFLPIIDRIRIQRVCKRFSEISKFPWRDMRVIKQSSWKSEKDKIKVKVTFDAIEKVLSYCGKYLINVEFKGRNSYGYRDSSKRNNVEFPLILMNSRRNQLMIRYHSKILDSSMKFTNRSSYFYDPYEGFEFVVDDVDSALGLLRIICASPEIQKLQIRFIWNEFKTSLGYQYIKRIFESIADKGECIYLLHLRYFMMPMEIDMKYIFNQMTNLRHLELVMDDNVDDDLLEIIGQKCKLLESARFSGSDTLTDRGLIHLSNLVNLELHRLIEVTGTFLLSMKNLEKVEIRYCHGLEDENILLLLDTSKKLREIKIQYNARKNIDGLKCCIRRYFRRNEMSMIEVCLKTRLQEVEFSRDHFFEFHYNY